MELLQKTINTCDIITKGTAQTMTEGDVIVPDTKPDILKLLQVDSDTCLTDKYIENGKLILCGKIEYKILYIPDVENEKIKSIFTSMEYRQVIDAKNAEDYSCVLAKPMVEHVEFNTVNSRKLRLRAVMHIDYEVCRIRSVEITNDINEDNIEKRNSLIEYESTANISEHDFTVKEKLEIPNGEYSINEILKTDVKISDVEYKSVTGKVIVKGILEICVLYTTEEDEIKYIESEAPFTEVFDAEGVSENSVCDIDYSVINVMFSPEPDLDGDLREIRLDVDICASLKATEMEEAEILDDCFVPYKITDCQKEQIKIRTTIERPCTQNTLRETIEIPQGAPEISSIYNLMTEAVITKTELQRDKIVCEGKIEAYILYLANNSESPVYSLKKEIPFSYLIEHKNGYDGISCELKSIIKHTSYNLNSDGNVEIRSLIGIECMLIEEKLIKNISAVITADSPERNGIVIYFSKAGESIWDIAKHYKVPCEKLIEYNELTEDMLNSERKLFIPMN